MVGRTSRIPEFYKKNYEERLAVLRDDFGLSDEDIRTLKTCTTINFSAANRMVENVVSVMSLPLGIATNFIINGVEYLIPMSVEESSVIAAACNAAKLARSSGGFTAHSGQPIMTGQIQLMGVEDIDLAKQKINENKARILALANMNDKILIMNGGGAVDLECKDFVTARGIMLILYLHVNVCDAMGGNIVNAMVESVAPFIAQITGGYVRLRIISNYSIKRMVKATAIWRREIIGDEVIEGILDADALAHVDPFRAATHNKGIMNGIDAVALATGNDFRAIEAGAHSYAVKNGSYQPLSHFYKNEQGDLVGELELPMAVGIIGGIIRAHPIAQVSLKILGVATAQHLAQVMVAVGLAQNFAALRVLVSEGIQQGHMRLHSRNLASNVGAFGDDADVIARQMIDEHSISAVRAREIYDDIKRGLPQ